MEGQGRAVNSNRSRSGQVHRRRNRSIKTVCGALSVVSATFIFLLRISWLLQRIEKCSIAHIIKAPAIYTGIAYATCRGRVNDSEKGEKLTVLPRAV